jgi:hypothetical protein
MVVPAVGGFHGGASGRGALAPAAPFVTASALTILLAIDKHS